MKKYQIFTCKAHHKHIFPNEFTIIETCIDNAIMEYYDNRHFGDYDLDSLVKEFNEFGSADLGDYEISLKEE